MHGFSRETHDRNRKWACDTVLDEHSSSSRVVGRQGSAFQAYSWGHLQAHPMVHLFSVRPGKIPQLLQVLMFALQRPLPHCTALTSWRLWNNLKLASRDIADTFLLHLVFESKIQEANGSTVLIFCMQNFIFSAFPTGATWGCCWPWALFMSHKFIYKVILCPYQKDWCIQRPIQKSIAIWDLFQTGSCTWNQSSSALRQLLLPFGSQIDIWILLGVWSMSKTSLPCSIPFEIWGFFPALPGTSLPFPPFHWIFLSFFDLCSWIICDWYCHST